MDNVDNVATAVSTVGAILGQKVRDYFAAVGYTLDLEVATCVFVLSVDDNQSGVLD